METGSLVGVIVPDSSTIVCGLLPCLEPMSGSKVYPPVPAFPIRLALREWGEVGLNGSFESGCYFACASAFYA